MYACRSHDAQFHLWKALISSNPTGREPALAYCRQCKEDTRHEPLRPLPEYLSNIHSPSIFWLTALTLSKIAFPRRDLYQLSRLQNLVALDICAPSDQTTDRSMLDPFSKDLDNIPQPLVDNQVLRHFATHADVASAFQSLRVLVLRGFKDVTGDALHYLNSFPRLSLFGVQNCGIGYNASRLRTDEMTAKACGWTTEDERGLLRSLKHEIEMSHTWDGMLRACVEMTAVFEGQSVTCKDQPNMSSDKDAETQGSAEAHISPLERSKSAEPPSSPMRDILSVGEWRECVKKQDNLRRQRQHWCKQRAEIDLPSPQPDPPLLNFKIGPTCGDLIFSTPMVFFRCMHGHIGEETEKVEGHTSISRTTQNKDYHSASVKRSESKNRRPSGPSDPRAAKRPKLRAGRSVKLTEWFEMQGVGRRLSSIELEKA